MSYVCKIDKSFNYFLLKDGCPIAWGRFIDNKNFCLKGLSLENSNDYTKELFLDAIDGFSKNNISVKSTDFFKFKHLL